MPSKKAAKRIHQHKCQAGYHMWDCADQDCYGSVGMGKPSKTRTCPSCMKVQMGEPEAHESYGMANISHFSSRDMKFFGSSIKHSGGMGIEISTATKIRNLSYDRYHSKQLLIRVVLSPAQFADLITSPNGGGVPCTIEWYDGKRMAEPPDVPVREQFVNEFEHKVARAFKVLEEVTQDIEDLFKTGKGSRVDIRSKLARVRRELAANAPFILEQFNIQMDKIVTEAKGEVESFVEGKVRSLGINALQSEVLQALSAPLASPALLIGSEEKEDKETKSKTKQR